MSKFSKLLMAASFAALVCGGAVVAPVLAQGTMAWSVEDSTTVSASEAAMG